MADKINMQQVEKYKEEKPVQYDIVSSRTQECLVVKAPTKSTCLQAFSLVWEGDDKDHIIDVKYGCSHKLEQEYYMSVPGDIINVKFNGRTYLFEGNKTKKNMIENFVKANLKKEVKPEQYEKALKDMANYRKAIEKLEVSTGTTYLR